MSQISSPTPVRYTRRYQAIWETLKLKGECILSSPKAFHRRIIKAVMKEKLEDLGYKLELSELGKKATLDHSADNNILKFKLTKTIRWDNI